MQDHRQPMGSADPSTIGDWPRRARADATLEFGRLAKIVTLFAPSLAVATGSQPQFTRRSPGALAGARRGGNTGQAAAWSANGVPSERCTVGVREIALLDALMLLAPGVSNPAGTD